MIFAYSEAISARFCLRAEIAVLPNASELAPVIERCCALLSAAKRSAVAFARASFNASKLLETSVRSTRVLPSALSVFPSATMLLRVA